jgi:hypothetical protein
MCASTDEAGNPDSTRRFTGLKLAQCHALGQTRLRWDNGTDVERAPRLELQRVRECTEPRRAARVRRRTRGERLVVDKDRLQVRSAGGL